MKQGLLSLGRKLMHRGQRAAWRHLVTECLISYYHRKGLLQVRLKSLSRPSKLHLGCGPIRKAGFLNVDLFPGGDLTLDLRRGLPFDSNCCELIFSEHFFEHIDYPDPISHLFAECHRILKPGGVLTFSVPGTEWPVRDYTVGPEAPYFQACQRYAWHPPDCTTRMEHINYHFRQFGQHLFAYDGETARKALEKAGFADVTEREYQPEYDSEHRRVGSLFMSARNGRGGPECNKPT